MATGTGKTKVLSLVLAWSFFHKLYEPDSKLAHNFLVIAPNIIVLDRIRKDFDGLRIFFEDPVCARQRLRWPQLARRLSVDVARTGRSAQSSATRAISS